MTRNALLAKSGITGYTVGCPGCDRRSYRHLLRCQQKSVQLGFSASSGSREALGEVVMGEVPTPQVQQPPPPAQPAPNLKTLSKPGAIMTAVRNQWKAAGQSEQQDRV